MAQVTEILSKASVEVGTDVDSLITGKKKIMEALFQHKLWSACLMILSIIIFDFKSIHFTVPECAFSALNCMGAWGFIPDTIGVMIFSVAFALSIALSTLFGGINARIIPSCLYVASLLITQYLPRIHLKRLSDIIDYELAKEKGTNDVIQLDAEKGQ